jgi:Xaa-Pro dipeptidase
MLLNRSRAIQFMRECGLDVIVATSPVNVTYFSEYYCWTDPLAKEYMGSPGASSNLTLNCAVFPLEGELALVLGPAFALNACDSWARDLRIYGDFPLDWSLLSSPSSELEQRYIKLLRERPRYSTAPEALVATLRERGLEGARIGLDAESLPAATLDVIRKELPRAEIKNCSNLIRLIRMVKTEEELKRLVRAAEISEQAVFDSFALARPGGTASELTVDYRTAVAKCGADFDHFIFGARGLTIFSEPEYHFVPNDVMYTDFGCIYGHYFSDSGATLAVNGISSVLSEKYAAVRACMDAGAGAMRPGVKASAVQAAMVAALKERGITASFPHGHGIGMEIRDYPILVPDNGLRIHDDCVNVASDLPMEVGMVNNLEVCVFFPVVGSVAIEESFLVTAEGSRQLVPQDRRAPIIAARHERAQR